MTSAERETDKRISRALMEYSLIESGDRILIALSGGKDSLALAWNLARKSRGYPLSFHVEALHLETGFADPDQPSVLSDLLAEWGMTLNVLSHPAAAGAEAGSPPNCFGCARDRRRILLEYAADKGFNKIALGHHMDDSLTTLLMNMSWNGEMAAMPPILKGKEGNPAIIRPLILLQEKVLTRLALESEWPVESCRCPWAGESRRVEAARWLELITGGVPKRKLNLWNSLVNRKPDLLPPETQEK